MTKESRAIILTRDQADLILCMTGNVDILEACTSYEQKEQVCYMRMDIQQQLYKQDQLTAAWAEYKKAQAAIMDAQTKLLKAQEALEEQKEKPFEEQTRLLNAVYRVKNGDMGGITTDGITIIPTAVFDRLTEICEKNGLNIYDLL